MCRITGEIYTYTGWTTEADDDEDEQDEDDKDEKYYAGQARMFTVRKIVSEDEDEDGDPIVKYCLMLHGALRRFWGHLQGTKDHVDKVSPPCRPLLSSLSLPHPRRRCCADCKRATHSPSAACCRALSWARAISTLQSILPSAGANPPCSVNARAPVTRTFLVAVCR